MLVPNLPRIVFRRGLSYLERLEQLTKHINRVVIPWVEVNYTSLADAVIDNSIQLQDPVMAELIIDEDSATSLALADTYEVKGVSYTKNESDNKYEPLDTAYTKSEADAKYEPIDSSYTKAEADGRYEPIDTAYTKAETTALIDAGVAGTLKNADVISVKLGGKPNDDKFATLRAGLRNIALDTRVAILGSSNANAGVSTDFVTKREKACMERLARRSGNSGYMTPLDGLGAGVGSGGMRWYNGAEGNTTSANYYQTTRRTKMGYVNPNVVIHMIGENDYYYGTSIANYKLNVDSACDHIEGLNAGAINVLVHSPGRNDVVSPVATWDAYGAALKEVAELNPSKRVFIDASQFFLAMGTLNIDRMGIIPDGVHLRDRGQLYLSNIIGAYLGIPSETDFDSLGETIEFIMPATATYTAAGAVLSEVWFNKVAYPREAFVHGSVWGQFSNGNGYFQVALSDSNPAVASPEGYSHTTPTIDSDMAFSLADSVYIPPGVSGRIAISLWPESGNAIIQAAPLSKVKVTFKPV